MESQRQTRRPRALFLVALLALVALSASLLIQPPSLQRREDLDPDDPRARAALEHLWKDSSTDSLISRSKMLGAWLYQAGDGYRVEVGLEDDREYSWLLCVSFDGRSMPIAGSCDPWTARSLPRFFGRVALTLAVLLPLCGIIIPYTFGVKCPDCTNRAFLPTLTRAADTIMYHGGFDAEGFDLPPVVKREFICPACGYRRITYRVGAWYGAPGPLRAILGAATRLSPLAEKLDITMDSWKRTLREKARFKNYGEWKAYFEELKQSEHEERP
ncbi:MAG: hypothetical protein Q8P50_00815 [Bacillota bacterium]|nr:hypothetical protein [Bacillota bacterium]